MTCEFSRDDAAYVLGALPPGQRQTFESHLAGCTACSQSVRDLAGLPGLLARVDPAVLAAEPADEPVPATLLPGLVRRVRRTQRRRLFATGGLAAAAAAMVALGSVAATGGLDSGAPTAHSGAVPLPVGRSMLPLGQVPLRANLAFTSVLWGTRLDLTCSYGGGEYGTPPAQTYVMVVRTRDGHVQQVASWRSLPGRTMRLAAATATGRQEIASVEVRSSDGRPVLKLTA